MGLFGKKKEDKKAQSKAEQSAEKQAAETLSQEKQEQTEQKERQETKVYIQGAGGTIVTKSILNGTSKLKWLFRQDSGHGNGWVAFGDRDSQEYVNDAQNMEIVDFNTLANIEPTVVNVFYMPMGSDLEFRCDKTGKYFVDTRTGKEIREPVKHPAQIAFEKNLKFLNQENYPAEFFEMLFTESPKIRVVRAGEADFPTGEVVLADPLAYLGSQYETVLDKRIPAGSYPVELSVCLSRIAGLRFAAARLSVSDNQVARYEIAMPKGKKREELGMPGTFTFFGVDTGLACFADGKVSGESRQFFEKWEKENPGKNKYTDYFAALFQESLEAAPQFQNSGTSFLEWKLPGSGLRTVLFSSGMGDGIFSGYWGLDAEGKAACLVVIFMNPEYF
ncbi:DUF2185 domain-containing protein [Acetatifactor muris]|uniref:Immunity protein Imm33 domain-containing protein n=1 Tax=Acetatifactor muris TaxID=879566 RepID=A0A2K4ZJF3_9FIRM|nr:DUF2185 domain-containing protein [Acetatifactor muris]MCR2048807.1 DUF2185 domain-containing protein [Acetatifactor muris]SOY30608.1 hypothetical protein AMURIS_03339 [Acetatifactor muris]